MDRPKPGRCPRPAFRSLPVRRDLLAIETVHQRTLHVGARLEKEAIVSSPTPSTAAQSITLSINGGHVRSVRSYQMRSFEILLAQVSNDDGKQVVFSSVPAEADRQREQLRGVLRGLGGTSSTPVTILSDGVAGPRILGEAASLGPTPHGLDWFHLAMRIQHVPQAAKGWPDASAADPPAGAALADTIERIRWRLWHGQVKRALDLIDETAGMLEAGAEAASSTAAPCKVAWLLRELETYVSGHSALIIDSATARRCEEPTSTAVAESTAIDVVPPDECPIADALVTARGASDAEGQNGGDKQSSAARPYHRRATGPPAVSSCGISTPRFWTVLERLSKPLYAGEV